MARTYSRLEYDKLLPFSRWIIDHLDTMQPRRDLTWLAKEVNISQSYMSKIVRSYLPANACYRQPNERILRAIGRILGDEGRAVQLAGQETEKVTQARVSAIQAEVMEMQDSAMEVFRPWVREGLLELKGENVRLAMDIIGALHKKQRLEDAKS